MYEPKSIYTSLALAVIISNVRNGNSTIKENDYVSSELKEQLACFVSIHSSDGALRGCIGTLEPTRKNLRAEIISNAAAACMRDSRFEPLSESELESIEISVDVLSKAERIYSTDELDPEKYGLILSDGKYRKGVLLPSLPGISTVSEQIAVVKKKAKLEHAPIDCLKMFRFRSIRYS